MAENERGRKYFALVKGDTWNYDVLKKGGGLCGGVSPGERGFRKKKPLQSELTKLIFDWRPWFVSLFIEGGMARIKYAFF
jgi:hypothetical protein